MAKSKKQKTDLLKDVVEKLKNSKSVVISDFTGLKVPQTEELRDKCKNEGVELLAVKKTIIKKALADANVENADKADLDGSLMLAFGVEDEVAPAKILADFMKDNEAMQFCGGVLENEVIDLDKIKALAALPSKPELYAKIVGSINAPVSGFVNVLSGSLRNLLNVLNAVKDTKQA